MGTALKSSKREFQLLDENGDRIEAQKIKMNKKADKKLGTVADMFCQVLPENCSVTGREMLYRKLCIKNLEPLNEVMLVYDVENRFAAISYNLLVQTLVKTSEKEERAYSFELKYDGMVKTKSMRFEADNHARPLDEREKEILKLLNEPLIMKKINQLGLLGVVVKYQVEMQRWVISARSMVGSSTWILLPPVMQLIVPVRQEIYQFVELMRLLTSVVSGDVGRDK